ncbi:MAG: cob(I)yrinic acid a,c-diamide adenosyltransferase [Planctomycetota bacterium]|jgi:cob(I)alamin adenosyltransferase
MLEKGLVQIYTGDGKGKTTAAFGLALRAIGHNAKVLIYQFLKPPELKLGERGAVSANCPGITLRCLDEPWDMFKSMHDDEEMNRIRASIHDVLQELETAAHEKYYDLIILDEIVYCLNQKLVSLDDTDLRLSLGYKQKPPYVMG